MRHYALYHFSSFPAYPWKLDVLENGFVPFIQVLFRKKCIPKKNLSPCKGFQMRRISLEYLTQLSPCCSLLVRHLDLCVFAFSSVSSHPCHLSATCAVATLLQWATDDDHRFGLRCQSFDFPPCRVCVKSWVFTSGRLTTKTDLCAVWHLWPQRTNFAFNKAFKNVTTTFSKVFLCVFLLLC